MNRQEANRKILKEMSKVVEKSPDLRFHQLLYNMGIQVPVPILDEHGQQAGMHFKDLHSEESLETFERMTKGY